MNTTSTKNRIDFSSLFSPDDVLCRTELTARDDVIRELLTRLALNRGIGNVNEAYNAIIAREESQATTIAEGVAMPHARLPGIGKLTVAIATSLAGIAFAGEQPAHLVILILAPVDAPALYLQALSSLARICSEKNIPEAVAKLETSEEVWKFFARGGMVLPPYVCAGDIMVRHPIAIKDTDTLKSAIDLLSGNNLIDLPVVDKDGELVGSVSAYELLRVCLPDYILWMDDLSPIINFEPFANVLRNESNTWLAEIMSRDYVVVGEDEPAIQVAKELTKNHSRQAYVVRQKKLVGVITLQHFVSTVLRE
jgi:mannitol/fructose-specific phosphotransferase system IIA component (Ntr-type)/CBS domain-containing protein